MAGLFNWRMMQNEMKRPARTGNSAEVVSVSPPDICSIALGTVIYYSIQFTVLYITKNYLILLVSNQSVL